MIIHDIVRFTVQKIFIDILKISSSWGLCHLVWSEKNCARGLKMQLSVEI